MSEPEHLPRIVALIATYNEADIIAACLEHLFAHGVLAYILDDGSSDETVAIAEGYLNRGLIGLESLPQDNPPVFNLRRILERKETLATQLEASWFINHDADEFRESPWAEMDLRDAIACVDRLGWSAIDFKVFNLTPVGDPATAHVSPDELEAWWKPGFPGDRNQVRAWKKHATRVDLQSNAGHDVQFTGRRVFPLRFPMRHYPIRSQAHGERKLFEERLPRFSQSERALGWHLQYADRKRGDCFVAVADDVRRYDATTARVESALDSRDADRVVVLEQSVAALEAQIQVHLQQIERLHNDLHDHQREASHLLCEIEKIYRSRSWKWTAPVRAALKWLGFA